jgi:hypothetical protein|tara:strand:- start:27661 stop:27972 length:312 start_codon:yes stop_codon:yes gene_type:complete
MSEELKNNPEVTEQDIQGVPVILDLATADDITIRTLQLTLVDAYDKKDESEDDSQRYDNLHDAVYSVMEYLLPTAGYEKWAFDVETILNQIDEEKSEVNSNGE